MPFEAGVPLSPAQAILTRRAQKKAVEAVKAKRKVRAKIRRRVEVEGDGVVRAMRHVLTNPEEFDRTGEEFAMRAWLKKDPPGFYREKELRESGSDSSGESNIEVLIAKLLKEGARAE